MKKLRIFDSLKFVRFVVAVVVATFILNVAHAATLPAGYTELEYLESTGTQWINTGYKPNAQNVKYAYGVQGTNAQKTSEMHPARIADGRIQIYRKDGHWSIYESSPSVSSSQIQNLNALDKVDFVVENNYDNSLAIWANNINVTRNYTTRSNTYTTDITLFTYTSSTTKFVGRIYYFRVYENGVVRFNAVPVRRDSDGVLGMYDLADSNPETAFHTNAGTGNFIAGEYKITIATTRYNEAEFAPVETGLDAAVAAVNTVVTQTMDQAQQIDQIANEKQTRPEDGCPRFKKCLLVEDEQGVPHWYEIYDPMNDFLNPILAAAGLSGNQGAPVQTTETSGSDTLIKTSNIFYNGDAAFRKKYIDGTNSAVDRPFGPTTLARCAENATRTTSTQQAGICYDTGGMLRTLTDGADDDSGEWALVWNGGEGGENLGITPGVVYGVAKCTSVGRRGVEGAYTYWPRQLTGYSGGGTPLASLIEQYPNLDVETVFNTLPNPVGTEDNPENPRANYRNCWCKMTAIGVPGAGETFAEQAANGTIMSVAGGGWVFFNTLPSATNCAYYCANSCALNARANAAFRRAVLGVGAN